MNTLVIALHGFVVMADPPPSDSAVKAGWPALWLFIGMVVAVGLLCWSMYRHLKKVRLNAEAGVFGEENKPDA
jgi:hypothetical protein